MINTSLQWVGKMQIFACYNQWYVCLVLESRHLQAYQLVTLVSLCDHRVNLFDYHNVDSMSNMSCSMINFMLELQNYQSLQAPPALCSCLPIGYVLHYHFNDYWLLIRCTLRLSQLQVLLFLVWIQNASVKQWHYCEYWQASVLKDNKLVK
jgi:hypothetical protein